MLELTSDKIQHESWNNRKEILSLKYKKGANNDRAGFIQKKQISEETNGLRNS